MVVLVKRRVKPVKIKLVTTFNTVKLLHLFGDTFNISQQGDPSRNIIPHLLCMEINLQGKKYQYIVLFRILNDSQVLKHFFKVGSIKTCTV